MTQRTSAHIPSGSRTRAALSAFALVGFVAAAEAQTSPYAVPRAYVPADVTPQVNLRECGNFRGHYGPFDYRTASQRDRVLVESAHFEMELATFLAGRVFGANTAGTGPVAGGFQYALKSFPNHPVALLMMEQLGRKLKTETPQGLTIPLECWFMRAFMIAPDDPAVRAIYGVYLANRSREPEAMVNLKIADAGTHFSPAIQHQIGMTYFQLKQYKLAQLCALRLARRNFAIDALERQLRDAGKWDANLALPAEELLPPDAEADPAAAAGAASAASAPTALTTRP